MDTSKLSKVVHTVINSDTGYIFYDAVSGKRTQVDESELGGAIGDLLALEESIKLENPVSSDVVRLEIRDSKRDYLAECDIDPSNRPYKVKMSFLADTLEEGKDKIEKIIKELHRICPRFFLNLEREVWEWTENERYKRETNGLITLDGWITAEVFDLTYRCTIKSFNGLNDSDKNRLYSLYMMEWLCKATDNIL